LPSLEKVGVGERRLVKDEDGNDYYCYFAEETDVLAIRNTEKIQKILANPDNYSADDLLNLRKQDLHGISDDLRQKLIQLGYKKIKEKFTDEGYGTGEEKTEENPSPMPVLPVPKEKKPKIDFEKLYYELLAKIQKGEITNKEIITNSSLSEEKKQELYKLLANNQNANQETPTPTNYLPYLFVGAIGILLTAIAQYLL
jgi:hypothetical protein